MADDEGDDDRGAGGNSSDELMMMDSDDPDDDPMDDEDDDDGLEVIYNGLARDSNRSRLSLVHGLDASRSRNPSEVELVVISDDDETFARVDQTQVEQVLDKLREGADEDEEGQIDDDILFVGETFDTSNKRNKVDFLSWDFQDDRLAQVRPPPSEFGPLLPSDDLGPQSPRGSRRTRNRRGSRRARSASPMATPRARSRSRSAVLGDDVQAGRGHAGQAPARFNKLQWSQEVAEHPNKYELAMLGDFIKVLFMLPLLDEKQKGQQIQLAPGPLQPVLQNIQQLIRTHVSSDDEQIKAFHNYLSTLGLDSVIPIRSRVPISKFNLELLPLLPRTLTRPIPLLIPTFLQTQEWSTLSRPPTPVPHQRLPPCGPPCTCQCPNPARHPPRYLSVDMPPDYNHRLYKVPNGTHAGMALWVPPSNYAASSSATRAKRGDERFDTVVAMRYDVPFVIVVSPFNHDLRNLRYAMHARNILTVCLETVEEFVCLDRWLRLWCKLAGTAAQPVAAGE
ncbi:hypothetical protein BCR44DRAFT_1427783 [Catenaria anguillulae PL171]|uniref:Uncharacterized protein n=1 Tax=Catenaria anguillulae PL171 TaxID=765915 RepID=A0A1Y2HW05_9FUNG|nr:hypothetical protein BCR44DRAFT_1427783 [Catenaria anguillulae PL171]